MYTTDIIHIMQYTGIRLYIPYIIYIYIYIYILCRNAPHYTTDGGRGCLAAEDTNMLGETDGECYSRHSSFPFPLFYRRLCRPFAHLLCIYVCAWNICRYEYIIHYDIFMEDFTIHSGELFHSAVACLGDDCHRKQKHLLLYLNLVQGSSQ